VETRFLATFRTTATLESFTLAARQLGYSQSTVSAQIRALETETGTPLVDRSSRRFRLTDAGMRLLDISGDILTLETKVREIASGTAEPSGELRISAVESLIVVRLRETLAIFRKLCPRVRVCLRNSVCVETVDTVVHGDVDLAFVIMPPLKHPDLEIVPLKTEEMVFVAPGGTDENLLVRALELGRLDECFIFTEPGCTYRIVVEHFFRERGILPESRMELWSMDAIRRYVEDGFGISFMPRMYVAESARRGTLTILNAPTPEETFRTQLAYRKRCDLSPAAQEFVRLVLDAAGRWDEPPLDENVASV
jgi:DNA-binding transcriptional LysR family regulator